MRVERLSPERWDSILPERGVEPFHETAVLEVIDRHTAGELRRYGVFDGNEPVGLVPVTRRTNALGTAMFSPPPDSGIPRLGPILLADDTDRSMMNRRFVTAISDHLGASSPLTLVELRCPISYDDPRPFDWGDLTPSFTWSIDRRAAAREMEPAGQDERIECETGDSDAAREVLAVADTETLPTAGLVADTVDAIGEQARIYRANERDETAGGAVVLYGGNTACCWFAGADDDRTRRHVERRIVRDVVDDTEPTRSPVEHVTFPGDPVAPELRSIGTLQSHYVVESPGKYVDTIAASDRGIQ